MLSTLRTQTGCAPARAIVVELLPNIAAGLVVIATIEMANAILLAAAAAGAGADGVIVGTRLVRAAGEDQDPPAAVGRLVSDFSAALSEAGAVRIPERWA